MVIEKLQSKGVAMYCHAFDGPPMKLVPPECPPRGSCAVSGPPGLKAITTFGPPQRRMVPPPLILIALADYRPGVRA